ncbi:MAG: glycoside hydrolase family 127 protein, partial [Bacteroidales bacterium]|nr:glycoside hydrolase family 127 protein [Bacteroidales bacterium]
MSTIRVNCLVVLAFIMAGTFNKINAQGTNIVPVDFTAVKMTDNFWSKKIETNREVTIPIAIHQCEITGRINNFSAACSGGEFSSRFRFDDSDVYKVIEGIAYTLSTQPNQKLEAKADSIIDLIACAQEDDGYLFTVQTTGGHNKVKKYDGIKWVDTHAESHELYCLGHMYEAAVAYYKATGKRKFLDVAIKSANLLCDTFGPGKMVSYPGHQEIELALGKLYRETGDERYLELAKFFLDSRGRMEGKGGHYYRQSHLPIDEQTEAVGHCVRGAYMLAGMIDVANLLGDENMLRNVNKLWEDIVYRKMFITGGIGPGSGHGEGFGNAYQLNNNSYCETCAAIAMVYV